MTTLAVKIPFEGFYASSHEAMFDDWLTYTQDTLCMEHEATTKQLLELSELFIDEIDWKDVHIAYSKEYLLQFIELVRSASRTYIDDGSGKRHLSEGLALVAEFEALESPKEYNFSTDCIYAKIPLEQLQTMLATIPHDVWSDYVESQYTSYNGFISFYSSNCDTWEEDLQEWGEARLGSLLECYVIHILQDETTSDTNEALAGYSILEDANGNGFIDELIFNNASEKFAAYYDKLHARKAAGRYGI